MKHQSITKKKETRATALVWSVVKQQHDGLKRSYWPDLQPNFFCDV